MLFGYLILTSPISAVARLIPFVGFILADIDFLVSLALAAITSLITVAVGWAMASPFLAIALLLIVGGIVPLLFRRRVVRTQSMLN